MEHVWLERCTEMFTQNWIPIETICIIISQIQTSLVEWNEIIIICMYTRRTNFNNDNVKQVYFIKYLNLLPCPNEYVQYTYILWQLASPGMKLMIHVYSVQVWDYLNPNIVKNFNYLKRMEGRVVLVRLKQKILNRVYEILRQKTLHCTETSKGNT